MLADERGSIIATSDSNGAVTSIETYDEYGKRGAANQSAFGYTGQMWFPQLGLWHYKSRMYAPHLGRFLQPDPIGYDGGMNLYAYLCGCSPALHRLHQRPPPLDGAFVARALRRGGDG